MCDVIDCGQLRVLFFLASAGAVAAFVQLLKERFRVHFWLGLLSTLPFLLLMIVPQLLERQRRSQFAD